MQIFKNEETIWRGGKRERGKRKEGRKEGRRRRKETNKNERANKK
jgi:hypothetical protein